LLCKAIQDQHGFPAGKLARNRQPDHAAADDNHVMHAVILTVLV
jgi:hypothetical protein